MSKKLNVIILVVAIFIIGIVYLFPLNILEYNNAKNLCNNYDWLQFNNMYLKRKEVIQYVFKLLGENDIILNKCVHEMTECTITDLPDYIDEKPHYITGELLNLAYVNIDIFNNVYLKYDKIMTVKETVALFQSCIQDIEHFIPQDATRDELKIFYKNAKKSGIITKKDLIYWLPIDVPLSKQNMYILINRFLQQPRYKYVKEEDVEFPEDKFFHRDKERTMTYLEFLDEIYN